MFLHYTATLGGRDGDMYGGGRDGGDMYGGGRDSGGRDGGRDWDGDRDGGRDGRDGSGVYVFIRIRKNELTGCIPALCVSHDPDAIGAAGSNTRNVAADFPRLATWETNLLQERVHRVCDETSSTGFDSKEVRSPSKLAFLAFDSSFELLVLGILTKGGCCNPFLGRAGEFN